jgi:hypothetical protein
MTSQNVNFCWTSNSIRLNTKLMSYKMFCVTSVHCPPFAFTKNMFQRLPLSVSTGEEERQRSHWIGLVRNRTMPSSPKMGILLSWAG